MWNDCGCSCDIDFGLRVVHARTVTTRKAWTCVECGERLPIGTEVRMETLLDASVERFCRPAVTCVPCARLRDDYCGKCFLIGTLRELISQNEGFDYVTGESDDS